MTRTLSWKRLLAVPATLALALGGALLTASPALAAPGDAVQITSPTEAAVRFERTFSVSGTGSDGDTVTVSSANGDLAAVTTTVDDGGTWSILITFPDDSAASQVIVADQVAAGETTRDTVAVTIPGPVVVAPVVPLTVTSPEDGATSESRTFNFVGTAPVGSIVTVSADGMSVPLTVDQTGAFNEPIFFGFDLGNQVDVTVDGEDENGDPLAPTNLTLTLAAPLAAPVVVSPAAAATVIGSNVIVSGTGVAGANLSYVLVGTDAQSASEAVGPVVGADGGWSFTAQLTPGSYTLVVVHTYDDGTLASLPSNVVTFTVAAAIAPAATGGRAELAATGAVTTGFATPAALVILAGLGMLVMSRRRLAVTA